MCMKLSNGRWRIDNNTLNPRNNKCDLTYIEQFQTSQLMLQLHVFSYPQRKLAKTEHQFVDVLTACQISNL